MPTRLALVFRCIVPLCASVALLHGVPLAKACDANNRLVHSGNHITWCANNTFWQAHSADVTPFFDFADKIVPQLTADFGFPVDVNFTIAVLPPVGYASTPTPYGPGVNITGDAFYNTDYNVKGFFGYLLLIHEFVNQWTGLANENGGWPTDWWANHRSPFPNAIDCIVLRELGLSNMADSQQARFLPGGDSADVQVPLFLNLFHDFGGWPFFQHYFRMMRTDAVRLDFRDPPNYQNQTMFVSGNPSPLLADYVLAYFQLAAQADVKARFDAAGVGKTPPNWTTPPTFQEYALNASEIASIAQAHCRMQDADPSDANLLAARARFVVGNYEGALAKLNTPTECSARCQTECTCDTQSKQCLPIYLASTETAGQVFPENPDSTGSIERTGTAGCSGCSSQSASASVFGLVTLFVGRTLRRISKRRARRATNTE